MRRLFLVRHARPAASWGQDADPGLDAVGVAQATATAQQLAALEKRLPVYTSPMRRCYETAVPLTLAWNVDANVFAPVSEIPAPPLDLTARHDWLMQAMRGDWSQLQASAPPGSPDYLKWRADLLDALTGLPHDCVVYTHFIAINAVVAAARGIEDVVCFRPDHASITVVRVAGSHWQVESLGKEAQTTVLAGAAAKTAP